MKVWEVDPSGYSSAGAWPWDDGKLLATRTLFDADVAASGLTSTAYLFNGCTNLVEVEGFEALSGVTNMNQMFTSCPSLETIWAAGFEFSVTNGSLMFSGCTRLVGGKGYVPAQMDNQDELNLGEDGVLTDPSADERTWFRCFLYGDGELSMTAATEPATGRELLAAGRLCANARYNAVGYQPWHEQRASVATAEIDASMAAYDEVNLNY